MLQPFRSIARKSVSADYIPPVWDNLNAALVLLH